MYSASVDDPQSASVEATILRTLNVAQYPLCRFPMNAPQVVAKTCKRAGGEGYVRASFKCEPCQGSCELPIRSIRHLLLFVLGHGTVGHGQVSSRREGRRDGGGIGEIEAGEDGVAEGLLGYRDRARRAIALQEHAEGPPDFSQACGPVFCVDALRQCRRFPPRTYCDAVVQPFLLRYIK